MGAIFEKRHGSLVIDAPLQGRYFEAPRWHDGRLWLVDALARKVLSLDERGAVVADFSIAGFAGGIALNGSEVVVTSMFERKLLRYRQGVLQSEIDLTKIAGGTIDDMIDDRLGRLYVGDLGFDLLDASGAPDRATGRGRILLVERDGSARVVAEGLSFPNGIAVAGDTLAVAESAGDSVALHAIAADGSLRLTGRLRGFGEPDGICIDAEGCIWMSLFKEDAFVRVAPDGRELQRISVAGRRAIACALGGADRRTLFGITALTTHEDLLRGKSTSWVGIIRVEIPGEGRP